jgi:hypothetical protein
MPMITIGPMASLQTFLKSRRCLDGQTPVGKDAP